jgi:hypothetical protein
MKSSNPLLILVLLAVLLQPVVLVLLLDRTAAPTPSPPDPELAAAMRELAHALDRTRSGGLHDAPATTTDRLAPLPATPERPAAEDPIPAPPRSEGTPTGGDLVQSWITHWSRLSENGKSLPLNLFFGKTTARVLADFGAPDQAYDNGLGVTWVYYDATEGRSGDSLCLSVFGGQVYRTEVN